MLRQLLDLLGDEEDGGDLIIEWWETPTDDDNQPMQKGYYAIYDDYPEEGGFPVMTFSENANSDATEGSHP